MASTSACLLLLSHRIGRQQWLEKQRQATSQLLCEEWRHLEPSITWWRWDGRWGWSCTEGWYSWDDYEPSPHPLAQFHACVTQTQQTIRIWKPQYLLKHKNIWGDFILLLIDSEPGNYHLKFLLNCITAQ